MAGTERKGVVYLVGAGPGDPEHITAGGIRRLKACDTVVYDSLSSDCLLDLAPQAEKIYVGKRAGRHSMSQDEINTLLVKLGLEGQTVVRLKGGDPFVFGRGGEEVLALQSAGIPYEVLPGVTSAVAALECAGIPVTHRAVSRSFHVMTGHTLSEEGSLPPDFSHFAGLSGTLIFLMGLGNLPLIVSGLIKAGKPADTPAAVIQNGTLPEAVCVRGTLSDIEKKVKEAGIGTPAIIAVGDTITLEMGSTIKRPLKGIRISVTGTDNFTEKLMDSLKDLGAYAECICGLGMISHLNEEPIQKAYEKLEAYTWVIFTSANAVRLFFQGLMESGKDFRCLGNLKMAVVGKGTARELRQFGFHADYMPDRYQVEDLAEGLSHMVTPKDRLLIPRSSGGSKILNQILDCHQIPYDDIILYDVISRQKESSMEDSLAVSDYLTFASASGVTAFFDGLSSECRKQLDNLKVVCIGDITAKALADYGREADLVAGTFSIPGMVEAILTDVAGQAN